MYTDPDPRTLSECLYFLYNLLILTIIIKLYNEKNVYYLILTFIRNNYNQNKRFCLSHKSHSSANMDVTSLNKAKLIVILKYYVCTRIQVGSRV